MTISITPSLSCLVSITIFLVICQTVEMRELDKYKWKRRLLIVSDIRDSSEVIQDIASYYECEMALRNMNVLILGPTESSDTTFTYTQNSSPQTSHSTNPLNQSIGERIREELQSRYKNLNDTTTWAVLIGYDGYRKNTYLSRNINEYLPGMFDQIDRMPMRRREMQQQLQSGIRCYPPLASSASLL